MNKICAMETGVVHLMIIWSEALDQKDTILEDLKKKFEILKIFKVCWSRESFLHNLRVFYAHSQRHLPSEQYDALLKGKIDHCGDLPFVAIVFRDDSPLFENRKTSSGDNRVNTRVFDLKMHYRKNTGGGHKIHASDTAWETNKDLTLLFGLNTVDFLNKYRDADLQEEMVCRDCVGVKGYASIGELFYVLNNTIKYVVLRNFECIPDEYTVEGHGDIDLLVSDKNYAVYLTSAEPVFPQAYRVYHHINIGGDVVPFDFRYVGDDYYDITWERDILETRTLTKNLFYTPNAENLFYSMLYHASVQKHEIKVDYQVRLPVYAEEIGVQYEEQNRFFILDKFLSEKDYEYVCPKDSSVVYNKSALRLSHHAFRYGQFIKRTDEYGDNGYVYHTKVYKASNTYVKIGTPWLIENEVRYLNKLQKYPFFPKLLNVDEKDGEKRMTMSKVEGVDSRTFFKNVLNHRSGYLRSYLLGCIEILLSLNKENVSHRDFLPENVIVTIKEGSVCVGLIDFGWAIQFDEKHPKTPSMLGGYKQQDRLYPDMFTWERFLMEYWYDLPYIRGLCYLLRQSDTMQRAEQNQQLKRALLFVKWMMSPYDALRLFCRRHQRMHFLKQNIQKAIRGKDF